MRLPRRRVQVVIADVAGATALAVVAAAVGRASLPAALGVRRQVAAEADLARGLSGRPATGGGAGRGAATGGGSVGVSDRAAGNSGIGGISPAPPPTPDVPGPFGRRGGSMTVCALAVAANIKIATAADRSRRPQIPERENSPRAIAPTPKKPGEEARAATSAPAPSPSDALRAAARIRPWRSARGHPSRAAALPCRAAGGPSRGRGSAT